MLTTEDIQRIIQANQEVFPTKEEFASFQEEMRKNFSEILTAVDGYANKADTYFQEMLMLAHKVDRHEKWLQQVADKLGKRLDASAHDEYTIGYRILLTALSAPLLQIAKNAGREDGAVILRDVIKKGGNFGYDASGESDDAQIIDMFEAGIIDPVKVTRSGVENAASAAAVLLTTDAAVADLPEEKKTSAPDMGGGMGMD
mgnify:CR=1 FL=1